MEIRELTGPLSVFAMAVDVAEPAPTISEVAVAAPLFAPSPPHAVLEAVAMPRMTLRMSAPSRCHRRPLQEP